MKSKEYRYGEFLIKETESENPNDSHSTKALHLKFFKNYDYIGEIYISGADIDDGFIYNFEVEEKFRGQGYGRKILEYVLGHFIISEVTVDIDNIRAINLYKSLGFKIKKKIANGTEYWMIYTKNKK